MKNLVAITAALALVACQTDDTAVQGADTQGFAVENAAPPGAGGLFMEIDGGLKDGGNLTFTVEGAQPNETVFFTVGFAPLAGGFCPPFLNGLCIDLDSPILAGRATSDAAGVAVYSVDVPNLPDGTVAFFQSVTTGPTAATSNVVQENKLASTGGTYSVVEVHGADLTATTWDGVFLAGFESDTTTEDLCAGLASTTGVPTAAAAPCPGCEFAFDVQVNPDFEELATPGDCQDFIGINEVFMNNWYARDTGWFGIVAGAQTFGIDVDYYDAYTMTSTPTLLSYDATYAAWAPLGTVNYTAPYAAYPAYVVFGFISFPGNFFY